MPRPQTEKEFKIHADAKMLQGVSELMKDKKRFDAAIKYLKEEKEDIENVIGSDGLMAALKDK